MGNALSLGFPIDLTLFQTPTKFDDHISSGFGVRVDKVRFWALFLVRKKILSIAFSGLSGLKPILDRFA